MSVIEVRDVFKIYQSGPKEHRIETVALKGVNLDVQSHDFITIIGPSGSGKTTLLNILGGLDYPSAGSITYVTDNRTMDIAKLNEAQLDAFRCKKIGVIFQTDNLLYHLTAVENVELALKFIGHAHPRSEAIRILGRLGLQDRLNHFPNQLSGGEKQRVALAAVLAFKPLIILADEPTGELDSSTTQTVMELFKEIHQTENIAFLFVTHNPIVARYGNRFFRLEDGQMIELDAIPSFDEAFMAKTDEYTIHVDKYHRLNLPDELIKDLRPIDDIVYISFSNGMLFISSNQLTDKNSIAAQVDKKYRILVPPELVKHLENVSLYGSFNEVHSWIEIERRNPS